MIVSRKTFYMNITVLVFTLALFSYGSAQEWEVFDSPNPYNYENVFWAVDGSSVDNVWAVGSYNSSNIPLVKLNFAAHWDGGQWQFVSTPNLGPTYNRLTGLAVISADEAWACGEYNPPGPSQMTLLHWDGNQWSDGDAPWIDGGASLHAMKKIGPDEIWAVGAKLGVAIAMHYEGSNWEYIEAPQVGARFNRFWAVDGTATDNVWAAGRWGDDWGQFYPLIMRWTGSNWQHIPGPDGYSMVINGISVIAPDDVWMVGVTMDAQPRFLHWDGQTVEIVPSPGGGRSIAGIAADDIWSVEGNSVVHWDGATWHEELQPDIIAARAVGIIPGGEMWAVGSRYDGGYAGSMTMKYTLATGIDDQNAPLPHFTTLLPNYPNPFNGNTSISISVSEGSDINLSIYDLLGRKVETLFSGRLQPGTHQFSWESGDNPSGVYFARLDRDGFGQTQKMTLLK